jgi:TrmH family RNA methyltransferase
MQYSTITSLHSPHIEELKALLGSRGKKIRSAQKEFVIEGAQSLKEALTDTFDNAPFVKNVYLTEDGMARVQEEIDAIAHSEIKVFLITDQMAAAISDAQSTQGIFALCGFKEWTLHRLLAKKPQRIAFLWECQDPGNAGTIIRTAAATGFDAVIFSAGSVDVYSPKVVRSTTGSLWHIPTLSDVALEDLLKEAKSGGYEIFALDGSSTHPLEEYVKTHADKPQICIFGNEARGLPDEVFSGQRLSLSMNSVVESYNLSIAAAITMYQLKNVPSLTNTN